MRLAHAGVRDVKPRQSRNGNHIWLVTCVITVIVVVFVAVRLSGGGCPARPHADGSAAAGGAGGPAAAAGGGGAARRAGTGTAPSPVAASPALAGSGIRGLAVFYDPGQAAGSCGLGPFPAGGWYASLPPRGYASGLACGSYVDVRGPAGSVRAEVVDVCTDCAAGTVDLSRAAFARIAAPRAGTVAVSYQPALDPPLPGPLVLRIAPATRPGTLAVQVINHGNRLSSVSVSRPGRGWQRLAPGADGYWSGPLRPARPGAGGPAGAPIRVRITDAGGHQVVLTGISPRSGVRHASAWMYRAHDRAVAPATRPAAAALPPGPAGPAAGLGSC
jgi:expansin (peptidoglycan-binding protein)